MIWLLIVLIIAGAILTIWAGSEGRQRAVYLFKPLTTILILILALVHGEPTLYRTIITFGLFFSLLGDIFLMLPDDHFLMGLVSFLLAHLAYIGAFGLGAGWAVYALALPPFLLFGGAVWYLLSPRLGKMRLPAFVYMLAILLMGWQAANQMLATGTTAALMALAGALLFLVSDSVLALNRFRKAVPAAQVIILSTYYAAQMLIALST